MCLIAGVVDGNFDANAGLVFNQRGSQYSILLKSGYKERRQKKSCYVSSLLPEIRGNGGLYCRLTAEVVGGGWTG
jgi:hypothetical protein